MLGSTWTTLSVAAGAAAAGFALARAFPGRRFKGGSSRSPRKPGSGREFWLGVDLGGTSAKVGLVDGKGQVLAFASEAHEGKLQPSQVAERICACCRRACEEADISISEIVGLGMGAPGSVRDGVVIKASNFPSWTRVPLADMVSRGLGGLRVWLFNDADAATAAEFWVGAGAEGTVGEAGARRARGPDKDLVMVTLGTGVGVGVVANGKLLAGATGTIEGGHHIVARGGRPCPCGQRGCLESYCSATGVTNIARDALKRQSGNGSALAMVERLSCKAVFEAALAGDKLALSVVEEVASFLAVGCINFMRILDPAVVVFSGGVTEGKSGELLLRLVRGQIEAQTWKILPTTTRLALSKSGRHAGVVGAVAAARMATDTT